MANRFSRIRESATLRPALDRYIEYLSGTLTRPSRVGTQGDRPETDPVYVLPFGIDLPVSTVYEVYVQPTHRDALAAYINNAETGGEVLLAPGANSVGSRVGFSPARVVWFRNATKSKTVETSDITNLPYLKYAGTRSSCPFGRKTATDDQDDVFQQTKTLLKAVAGQAVNRVSLQREKLKYS